MGQLPYFIKLSSSTQAGSATAYCSVEYRWLLLCKQGVCEEYLLRIYFLPDSGHDVYKNTGIKDF